MLKLRVESFIEYKDCDVLLLTRESFSFDELRTEVVKLILLSCCNFSLFCLCCVAKILFFDMLDTGRGVVVVFTVENMDVGC